MVIHQEKYKCGTCHKSFGGQASLKRHLKIHNGTHEKHFACNICDAKFTTKSNLKRHAKSCV